MSDDLVKRLRDHIAVSFDDRGHVFEDDALCDDAADRIKELEAKLAKAEDFIRRLNRFAIQADDKFLIEKSQEVLEELTGGKDA